MKIRRLLSVFLLAALLCGLFTVPAAALEDPDIRAKAALLVEAETGTILYDKNAHDELSIASTTKIMSALLIFEAIDRGELRLDQQVTATATALRGLPEDGSTADIVEGETLTVEQLLYCMLVISANETCNILGETVAGSVDAFVERMNQRAKELGMNDTTFKNATGLPAEGHVTSAHDIALMSRELILHYPDIRQYTTIWMDTLRDGQSQLVNTNKLIRFYEGATGLKTGSTDSALYCLSATAERDGMELISVIMKGASSAQRFEDAKALLSYGFSTYALKTIVPEEALPPVPVELGTQATVQPVLGEGNVLLLEKARAGGLTQTVELVDSVAAPVEAGDRLGTLTVTAGEETAAEIPILAGETVPRVTFSQMLRRLLRTAFLAG